MMDRKSQAAGEVEPEVLNELSRPSGICYTDDEMLAMQSRYTMLKPIEPGDRCCHCGKDCDDEGFSSGVFRAYRFRGHPLCARTSCYFVRFDELVGKRHDCKCGTRKR
jgi:hypothetical protein